MLNIVLESRHYGPLETRQEIVLTPVNAPKSYCLHLEIKLPTHQNHGAIASGGIESHQSYGPKKALELDNARLRVAGFINTVNSAIHSMTKH